VKEKAVVKEIKTLSMYLPQYYRTVENDNWWGEGFTDWTAVKAAKPIFSGHQQPKVPLDGNYYNLLERSVMEWQARLMKKYGIDGQCIYHYYFKEGRMVLEKPAENLLKWKDIDMPFCFCWANVGWIRTWQLDPWADKFRQGEIGEQILLEQKYGGVEAWENHFQYLLPFFKDERYIKMDGAPVFVIMMPSEIYCLEEMLFYWRRRAAQNGFPNMYFIICDEVPCQGADAILRHTPHAFYDLYRDKERGGVLSFDYGKLWDRIIEEPPHCACTTYFEGMANCDDTPRRGQKGVVLNGFSAQGFYEGMIRLYRKSVGLGNRFVFINAWNEWGEGMYLEPDEKYQYQVLEALKRAQDYVGMEEKQQAFEGVGIRVAGEQLAKAERKARKNQRLYKCLSKWMENLESGLHIADYLSEKKISVVAIYGYGMLGKHLLRQLENSTVTVAYLIDRYYNIGNSGLKVMNPEDDLEEVDAVIITPIWDYEVIAKRVGRKIKADVFSLEAIIYDM